jgi:hypothetical protein
MADADQALRRTELPTRKGLGQQGRAAPERRSVEGKNYQPDQQPARQFRTRTEGLRIASTHRQAKTRVKVGAPSAALGEPGAARGRDPGGAQTILGKS